MDSSQYLGKLQYLMLDIKSAICLDWLLYLIQLINKQHVRIRAKLLVLLLKKGDLDE